MDALSARNFLYERTRNLLDQKIILNMGANQTDLGPGNIELKKCLSVPPVDCTIWRPEAQIAFGLRTGQDPGSPLIVGTEAQPAVYGPLGSQEACAPSDSSCAAWAMEAWFWAECPHLPQPTTESPCPTKAQIFVRHRVRGLNRYQGEESQPEAIYFQSSPKAGASAVKDVVIDTNKDVVEDRDEPESPPSP